MRIHQLGDQEFSFPEGLGEWTIKQVSGREFLIQKGSLAKTAFLMAYCPEDKQSEWWIDGDVHVVRSVRPIDLLLDELGMTATAVKGPEVLLAPMPGLVLRVDATEGSAIEQGQTLIVLEAMKMENNLKSPAAGQVAEVYVQAGQAVEKGAKLLRFA